MVVVVVRGSPMVVRSFLFFSVFLARVGMVDEQFAFSFSFLSERCIPLVKTKAW